jgi:hypothetical protein
MILRIEITKQLNGSGVLQCARNDGSVTWQSKHAAHFALHDLTHYAIETALGFTEADILMYAHTPRSAVARLVCDCARAETGTNVRTA